MSVLDEHNAAASLSQFDREQRGLRLRVLNAEEEARQRVEQLAQQELQFAERFQQTEQLLAELKLRERELTQANQSLASLIAQAGCSTLSPPGRFTVERREIAYAERASGPLLATTFVPTPAPENSALDPRRPALDEDAVRDEPQGEVPRIVPAVRASGAT
ncbi:MAG: hypothetical protein HC777_01470 [Hyphomonadaceae bacterium]|nr:hypothetical protein [Hyphomonadaceae bacterium]